MVLRNEKFERTQLIRTETNIVNLQNEDLELNLDFEVRVEKQRLRDGLFCQAGFNRTRPGEVVFCRALDRKFADQRLFE